MFWILDNGSAHRGTAAIARLHATWPTLIPVHTPLHASWLHQIEMYCSVVQCKVLMPNDFRSLAEVEDCLLGFQERDEQIARPFRWQLTRKHLRTLMRTLTRKPNPADAAA